MCLASPGFGRPFIPLQILGDMGLKKRHWADCPAQFSIWLHAEVAMQEIGPLMNCGGG
jgi:hypothetical protein